MTYFTIQSPVLVKTFQQKIYILNLKPERALMTIIIRQYQSSYVDKRLNLNVKKK